MIKLGDLCQFCGIGVTVIVRRGGLSHFDNIEMEDVLFVGDHLDIPSEISEDFVLDFTPARLVI